MTHAAAPAPSLPSGRRAAGGAGVSVALAIAGVAGGATGAQAEEYVVAPGDTVSHIALRTSSTVQGIVTANGLDRAASIRAGQRLVIPAAAPAPAASPATHTVVRGDTVSALAKRYGTTTAAIVAANGLGGSAMIRIGAVLTIPTAGAAPTASPAAPAAAPVPTSTATHTVVRGDTVWALAKRYGTTTAAIAVANGLSGSAMIRIGQVLTLPVPAATGPALVGSTFAGRSYPAATVASANQNKATLLAMGVPSPTQMQALVANTARSMGVDPALAQAIAYQESGFKHTSVSPANAIGTMQVIPSSGRWASEMVGRELNLLDPEDNVVAGVAILRRLVATAPDQATAIAGYYQGLAGVKRNGMYPDTRRYVASVQTLMSRFA